MLRGDMNWRVKGQKYKEHGWSKRQQLKSTIHEEEGLMLVV